MFSGAKEAKVVDLIDRICSTLNINKDGTLKTRAELNDRADAWAAEGEDILTGGGEETMDETMFQEVQEYFKMYEMNESKIENKKEFEKIEVFIKAEKNIGRKRREAARLLAASEEVRVAAEVAELKAYRLKLNATSGDAKLQEKIADAEKAHANRKMVISKAARLATSDCRKQFKRVRDFFQSLRRRMIFSAIDSGSTAIITSFRSMRDSRYKLYYNWWKRTTNNATTVITSSMIFVDLDELSGTISNDCCA